MKKIIWLCLLMMAFDSAFSQVTLDFCASVEPNGYCNFNNLKFITQPDSTTGRIFMEVKSTAKPIGATDVIFKIYKVDKTGHEKFQNMTHQVIKPDWFFAWMPYMFESPGKFDVKVYNESDELICTNMFELIAFTK